MNLENVATFTNPGSGIGLGSAWSPIGDRLAVAGFAESVTVWDLATRAETLRLPHAETVSCTSWSPDGNTIATGASSGLLRLFSVASGQELQRHAAHSDEVRSVAYSPSGTMIATAGNDGWVNVWEADGMASHGMFRAHAGPARSAAWSPDGRSVASGGHDNIVRIWTYQDGGWAATGGLADHTQWIARVAYTPDGRYLASGGSDSTIRIWDLAAAWYHQMLDQFDDWWVFDFAISPDSRYIAALNNAPTLFVFDLASGERIAEQRTTFGTTAVSWSPDGRHIATSGHQLDLWAVALPGALP